MRARLAKVLDLLRDNPILLKELRIGLRERKIFLIQTVYLLVLGIATALFLLSVSSPEDLLDLPEQGQNLHLILFWSQLVMVLLITPSLTCGQISGERENRSLELLVSSRLRTVEIVAGKLAYALSYVGLLLASSLPMVAVVFLLGGVSPLELAASYGSLLGFAALSGLLGLFYSARERRTGYATNQTYGSLILLFILGLFLFGILVDSVQHGQTLTFGKLEVPAWVPAVFNGACVAVFLFLKAQNHLRRRVSHELWMGRLFLIWYLLDCVFLGIGVASLTVDNEFEGVSVLWCLGLSGALVAAGCFFSDNPFSAPREEARRRRHPMFRWWAWAAMLCLGLGLVGVLQVGGGADLQAVQGTVGFCACVILSLAVITRALHALLGERVKFAVIYYLLLPALLLLPMLPLSTTDGQVNFLMGVQLSPYPGLWSLWTSTPEVDLLGTPMVLASATVLSYLALAVALLGLAILRRTLRRKRA